MPFILPSNAFNDPSPALGALTGLTQGLAHGIPIARQLGMEQQRIDLEANAQKEKKLSEDEADKVMQGIAGLMIPTGPGAPGSATQPTQAPGIGPVGPGGQAPAPMPQQGPGLAAPSDPHTDFINRTADFVQQHAHGWSRGAQEALWGLVQQDLRLKAVQGHQARIISRAGDLATSGALTRKLPDGTEDPQTGPTGVQALIQQAQDLDPNSPEAATALDKIDSGLTEIQLGTVANNVHMEARRHQIELSQGQIDRRRAELEQRGMAPDKVADELRPSVALLESFKGNVDGADKQFSEHWNDAISGMLPLKIQMEQMRVQSEAAKQERDFYKNMLDEARAQKEANAPSMLDLQKTRHENTLSEIQARADANLGGIAAKEKAHGLIIDSAAEAKASAADKRSNLAIAGQATTQAQTDPRWSGADAPTRDAIVQEYAGRLRSTLNGAAPAGPKATPAKDLLEAIKSKKMTVPQIRAALAPWGGDAKALEAQAAKEGFKP